MQYRDVPLAIDRRRERPPVLVSLSGYHMGWPRIVERFRERGWRLVDPRYRGVDPLSGVVPQGAIVDSLPTAPLVRRLLKMGCPVVRIGNAPHPKDSIVPAVMPDWGAMGRLGADHFASRGFKHLGFVGFQPWDNVTRQKILHDGFRARAKELGCECRLLRWKTGEAGDTAESKYRHRRALLAEWLKSVPKPVGLLGFVDGFAAKLCCMCQDVGLAVPEEVAVLGVGNILPACEGSIPTLSSIVLDDVGVAEAAVRMLARLMQGKTLPETTVRIPPLRIVTRESTDLLAVGNLDVARALRYMWDHLDLDLSVDRIAREIGVSRRTLEREFRKHLGRSVNVELRRKRLEQLKLLLRTTDTNITDLAPLVGFRSTQYLHRAFRAAFGMSPKQYRNAE